MFEPKVFWDKCTVLKKKLATLLGLFGARGIVLRRYAPGGTLRNKVR